MKKYQVVWVDSFGSKTYTQTASSILDAIEQTIDQAPANPLGDRQIISVTATTISVG